MEWKGVIKEYIEYLPVSEKTPIITLNEGNTPLIKLSGFQKEINADFEIYVKFEGLNPTASFKDRGMTVAISKAVEEGSRAVMCASTGNTSASAAAYAARAGIDCIVIIPEGAIALGKLSQALMHNAKVIALKGNFDDALEVVKYITDKYPIQLVNSINPFRIEGQKTAAFEVIDWLGCAPEYQCMPIGNAGNITAYWKGYNKFFDKGKSKSKPVIFGFQAKGSAPIYEDRIIKEPKTIATAIKIGNPARWQEAVTALNESNGEVDIVSDEEIVDAYRILARTDGLFVEPASAASIAGLIKKHREGKFKNGSRVVCVCTGHGLKDPDCAINNSKKPVIVENKLDTIINTLGL